MKGVFKESENGSETITRLSRCINGQRERRKLKGEVENG